MATNPLQSLVEKVLGLASAEERTAIEKAAAIKQEAQERAAVLTRLGELELQLSAAEALMNDLPANIRARAAEAQEKALTAVLSECAAYGVPATPGHVDDILRWSWIVAHLDEVVAGARNLTIGRINREQVDLRAGKKAGFLAALGLR